MNYIQHRGTQGPVSSYFIDKEKDVAQNLIDLLVTGKQEVPPLLENTNEG